MAYKFQLGAARLSGSTTFEEAATFESSLAASSLSASSLVSGHQLDIETSANIAGDIDSAGDLTVGSITMSEFTVDSSGNTDVDGTLNVEGVPTFQAGAVFSAGITTANAIAGATTISGSGVISGLSLDVEKGADLNGGGLSNAGAIAGASTIDASGDLTVGSITMAEFTVDSSGNTDVDGTLNVEGVPTFQAGAVFSAGITTANAIAGATTISGSGVISGLSLDVEKGADLNGGGLSNAGAIAGATTVSGSGNAQFGGTLSTSHGKFVVDADGDVNAKSLDVRNGGISQAGAIAGATNIDGSGDLTMGSITLAEFTVDSSGNTDIDGTLNVEGVPTFQAGAVFSAGITTANAIAGATTISGSGTISGGALTVGGALTGGKLVVGSADLSEAELEQLDGITAGTVAASKAVVVDSNKDISGFRDVSADQDIKASRHVSASAQLQGSGALLNDDAVIGIVSDTDLVTLKDQELVVAGVIKGTNLSGSGTLQVGGEVTLDGVGEASGSPQLAQDGFYIRDDSASGKLKFLSASDYATAVAGSGLSATDGVLSVTTNNVSAVVSGSTLSEGYNYLPLAAASGSAGVTLPASPSVGDFVVVKAGTGVSESNFVEIKRGDSNHKIDGVGGPVRIESPFGAVSLIYVVANDWRIV